MSPFEGLDDDHRGTTVGTEPGGCCAGFSFVCRIGILRSCIDSRLRCTAHQPFPCARQVVLACGIGEQSVVADAVEA